MSTFSCLATSLALPVGRTLKPMTMASEAAASITSLSLMAPIPERMMFTRTSSVESFCRASRRASSVPWTSALSTILSSLTSPSRSFSKIFSRDMRVFWACSSSRTLRCRYSATRRAAFSSGMTRKSSPARGTSSKPRTSTGVAGGASRRRSPRSLSMARTRPKVIPATKGSPSRRVPSWMMTVATGPLPRSSRLSMIRPRAGRSGAALRSSISA